MIIFNRLWQIMKEQNVSQYTLIKDYKISSGQLDRLRKEDKRAELSSDKDLAQFELLFGQAQETVNKMHGIMLKVKSRDEDAAVRLGKALKALAEAVGRCAE